jgi:hypothetical protein
MKNLLIALCITLTSCMPVPALAQHYHHGYWQHRGGPSPWIWVAPTVIGGVIGYEIAKQQPPVVVQQQPVIVQQQNQQYCSPWTEVQNPDGTITRTRTCTQ